MKASELKSTVYLQLLAKGKTAPAESNIVHAICVSCRFPVFTTFWCPASFTHNELASTANFRTEALSQNKPSPFSASRITNATVLVICLPLRTTYLHGARSCGQDLCEVNGASIQSTRGKTLLTIAACLASFVPPMSASPSESTHAHTRTHTRSRSKRGIMRALCFLLFDISPAN